MTKETEERKQRVKVIALGIFDIAAALRLVRREIRRWSVPYLSQAHVRHDPFRTLIACILSLRTKDAVTDAASERLFAVAATPRAILALGTSRLAQLIFPVGFYNQKARQITDICRRLRDEFNDGVPNSIEVLLTLPGVGRKTANLVVTEAFGQPGICVDTHVHRITNRWGYVRTRTPEQTEMALRAKLPARYWIEINRLLVTYGQHRCLPVSPICSECPVFEMCPRRGVVHQR
ncbi:MAG: endonuclease III [bacterium]|nr:endonuclease III [bacterium]